MRHKFNLYIVLFLLTSFVIILYSFPGGFVGTTKKPGSTIDGCICHNPASNPSVNVSIIGPDSVQTGSTVTYNIRIQGGPAVVGGFNVASYSGDLNPSVGDTMVRKQDGELTHRHPKLFSSGIAEWTFRYTAPNSPGYDTLYASGNSCNNDSLSDGDEWNWSPNRTVRVYSPIGIVNINETAESFDLSQNYPNPFNPTTTIEFSVGQSSDVLIQIYDIRGRIISTPVKDNIKAGKYRLNYNAENLSSGTYFYSLYVDGKLINTKKMLLLK